MTDLFWCLEHNIRTCWSLQVTIMMRPIDTLHTHVFLGPGKGCTCSVLSASTSATIGHQFPAWFASSLVLLLLPLSLLGIVVSHSPVPLFSKHDLHSVGLGVNLVSGYWGLMFLVLGMYSVDFGHWLVPYWPVGQTIAPEWFVFHWVLYAVSQHVQKHHSHISFMQQDRVQRFLNEKPYTVFVLGAGQTSISVGSLRAFISRMLFSSQCKVVTPSLTINNIMDILVQHQVIPTDYHDVYTLGYGHVGLLQGSLMIASLGAGSLSHFYLRTCVCGGASRLFLTPHYKFC